MNSAETLLAALYSAWPIIFTEVPTIPPDVGVHICVAKTRLPNQQRHCDLRVSHLVIIDQRPVLQLSPTGPPPIHEIIHPDRMRPDTTGLWINCYSGIATWIKAPERDSPHHHHQNAPYQHAQPLRYASGIDTSQTGWMGTMRGPSIMGTYYCGTSGDISINGSRIPRPAIDRDAGARAAGCLHRTSVAMYAITTVIQMHQGAVLGRWNLLLFAEDAQDALHLLCALLLNFVDYMDPHTGRPIMRLILSWPLSGPAKESGAFGDHHTITSGLSAEDPPFNDGEDGAPETITCQMDVTEFVLLLVSGRWLGTTSSPLSPTTTPTPALSSIKRTPKGPHPCILAGTLLSLVVPHVMCDGSEIWSTIGDSGSSATVITDKAAWVGSLFGDGAPQETLRWLRLIEGDFPPVAFFCADGGTLRTIWPRPLWLNHDIWAGEAAIPGGILGIVVTATAEGMGGFDGGDGDTRSEVFRLEAQLGWMLNGHRLKPQVARRLVLVLAAAETGSDKSQGPGSGEPREMDLLSMSGYRLMAPAMTAPDDIMDGRSLKKRRIPTGPLQWVRSPVGSAALAQPAAIRLYFTNCNK